jgi:hypothetical protein
VIVVAVRRTVAVRFAAMLVAALAAAASSIALAQAWSLQSGAVVRGEYTDNYFFTSENKDSGFTTSATPFVTLSRRTEASEVAAVAAIGGNWVSGPSLGTSYVSGRFGLDGTLRETNATWTGNVSFTRNATLQSEAGTGVANLGLAYTNALNATGSYTYLVTERLTLGASVSGYDNRYDSVASNTSFANNQGYYAGATAGYAFSETTQLSANVGYSYYTSDPSRSDSVTATLGVVYQYSPQLTVSASAGGFWTDTTNSQGSLGNTSNRATGGLFGGQFAYAFSREANITVSLAESLTPSGTGALSRSDNAGVVFVNRFSDRLTGRLGASYNRTTYPQSQSDSLDYNFVQGEVGLTYQLAERWTLDAGYRYSRAHYTQNSTTPVANVGFVSIGYNWPGTSFTDWVGRPPNVQGLPAAGPISLPESSRGTTGPPEASPFEPFTIP